MAWTEEARNGTVWTDKPLARWDKPEGYGLDPWGTSVWGSPAWIEENKALTTWVMNNNSLTSWLALGKTTTVWS